MGHVHQNCHARALQPTLQFLESCKLNDSLFTKKENAPAAILELKVKSDIFVCMRSCLNHKPPFLIRYGGPLQTARALLVSGFRGEQASVRLLYCQTVIKCMTQTMSKVQIKMSISCPELSHTLRL